MEKKNSPKKPWSFWCTEFTQMTGTINHAGVPFCWDGDVTANYSRKSHRWLLEYSGKLIHIHWAKAAYLGVPDFDPHPTCLKVGLAGYLYHSNCNSVGRPIGQTRWGHQIWNSVEQQPFQTWLSDWVHDRIAADSPCWDELGKQDLNDQMGWQASLRCNNVIIIICVCVG